MMSSMDLHIFFLPLLAPGHMIPMVDMAKLFAGRNVKVTIVTTTGNAPRIQPSLDCSPHPIQLLTLSFPSSVPENVASFPTTPKLTPEFLNALESLKSPFEHLLHEHRPDCIVSDVMYPWSAHLAVQHNIPRICFHGTSSFAIACVTSIHMLGLTDSAADGDRQFVVPGLPHRIEMLRSQIPSEAIAADDEQVQFEAFKNTFGTVMNSFCELEEGYTDLYGGKTWFFGPVSLCGDRDNIGRAVRGGGGGKSEFDDCLNWLDDKQPGSVLYVCFGSISQFTCPQLREIAKGLILSGHPFIWVVRNLDDTSEWMPEGFEEGKGFIVKGWAPQVAILGHRAVRGFLTHCGWNSCMEGATAGLPMVTWPLFAEQFFNERLLVDVLRIGVAVGSKVCSYSKDERSMVSGEEVKKAIEEVMGSGEEAEARRRRAKEIADMARKAVEEGGSSYNGLSNLIQELIELKRSKVVEGIVGE